MIIATYVVKDDADILKDSIEFHPNQGVDALIASANNSTPEVSSILDTFVKYIFHRIKEPDTT